MPLPVTSTAWRDAPASEMPKAIDWHGLATAWPHPATSLPPAFTLLQLQQTVEALAGRVLHKQNFRRLMEQQDLVEETGELTHAGAGRPAKLFRFRRDVLLERAISGSKLPLARGPK